MYYFAQSLNVSIAYLELLLYNAWHNNGMSAGDLKMKGRGGHKLFAPYNMPQFGVSLERTYQTIKTNVRNE